MKPPKGYKLLKSGEAKVKGCIYFNTDTNKKTDSSNRRKWKLASFDNCYNKTFKPKRMFPCANPIKGR
jgi:hypothetical protein